ncbi:uncharacterized protein FA14DRAFT_186825 [Meira miltonrushii]|uniref:Mitochondrial genome maintenance protein Mgr2 n=1 Tax=Meira miltonrushii TaxID=1280837 RepID=A0A316VG68_9BASI|nr:uncharacterized protein FA14DRAFT_186825 [Meira miltonrushii]PWN36627.1 hypothetical protein FA14DRAFT_186825 [Meira miltonrushii]
MATVSTVQLPQQPSVLQKLGMGAMMGTGVGLCIGFIGGAFQILRAGPGPKGTMGTLGQFMGTSAATFGFFMSIGTVIRTEGRDMEGEDIMRRLTQEPNSLRILQMERMKNRTRELS